MIRWPSAVARLVRQYGRRVMPGDDMPLEVLHNPGFVAIDVETTGLDSRRDALVALAAIPFVGGEARTGLITLVQPGRSIPPAATAVHGIRDEDVIDAPGIDQVLAQVEAVCSGRVVVGHDIGFDLAMLHAAYAARGLAPWPHIPLCTRRLTRAAHLNLSDSRLEMVAARLGASTAGRHTAEGDARMAAAILFGLLPALRSRGAQTVGDLLRLARTAPAYD